MSQAEPATLPESVALPEPDLRIEIGFTQWMMVGVPIVVIALPLAFAVLTWIAFPIHRSRISGGNHDHKGPGSSWPA